MNDEDFQNLLESVKEMKAIERGELKPSRVFIVDSPDVKAIRAKLAMTQREFAMMIGVKLATVQNWEQGRRTPRGPAHALLKVASHNPEAVRQALAA